jgi:hypothetical protein
LGLGVGVGDGAGADAPPPQPVNTSIAATMTQVSTLCWGTTGAVGCHGGPEVVSPAPTAAALFHPDFTIRSTAKQYHEHGVGLEA